MINKIGAAVLVIFFLLGLGALAPTVIDTYMAMHDANVRTCIDGGVRASVCMKDAGYAN